VSERTHATLMLRRIPPPLLTGSMTVILSSSALISLASGTSAKRTCSSTPEATGSKLVLNLSAARSNMSVAEVEAGAAALTAARRGAKASPAAFA
jgi:hypothetical protein